MRRTLLIATTLLLTCVIVLVPAFASAGSASARQCRTPLVSVPACAEAGLTVGSVSCGDSAPGDWTCVVTYTLALDVTGATCGEALSSVAAAPYLILCSTGLDPASASSVGAATYHDVPAGGETIHDSVEACVDIVAPIEACSEPAFVDTLLPGPP